MEHCRYSLPSGTLWSEVHQHWKLLFHKARSMRLPRPGSITHWLSYAALPEDSSCLPQLPLASYPPCLHMMLLQRLSVAA